MKRLVYIVAIFIGFSFLSSCLKDNFDEYEEWRNSNDRWLAEQELRKNPDGSPYYEKIVPAWNPNAYVLMHWYNDRNATASNLSPLSTSYTDIKYKLSDFEGLAKDSSYLRTNPADSIYRSKVNSNIEGWIIGVTNMHVGDSVTMIVPYQYAYGAKGQSTVKPYSVLVFDLKLKGIPGYEIPVN